jgi:hypothetical protein
MLWTVHQSFQSPVTAGGASMRQCKSWSTNQYQAVPGRIRPTTVTTVHVYMHGPAISSYLSHQRYSILPWFFSTVVACVSSLYLYQFQVLFLLGITVLLSSPFMRGTAWNFQFVLAKKQKSEYSKVLLFSKQKTAYFFQNGASMIFPLYCTHVLTVGRMSILCWSHHFSYRWQPSFGG